MTQCRTHGQDRGRRLVVALVAHGIHDAGGMERACAELIRELHTVVDFVVISAELQDDLRQLVRRWIRIRVPRRPFLLRFVLFFGLAGIYIRRARADLVHTVGAIVPNHVDVASVHFCHAGWRSKVGRWSAPESHGWRRLNSAATRAVALVAERHCYRRGRTRELASVSPGIARELRTFYADASVTVTPNGIDGTRFRPDQSVRNEVRSRFGVLDQDLVLCFVGGEWLRKGLDVAIEALAIAARLGATYQLWVVGEGDTSTFRNLAKLQTVEAQIHFFGHRRDVPAFLQASDVFISLSVYEAFNLAAYEAAACGIPVVLSETNGTPELAATGCCLVVDRTAAGAAAALVRLHEDPLLRSMLGGNGVAVGAEFTWKRSADAVLDRYRALASTA